jgi:hypothetical protein
VQLALVYSHGESRDSKVWHWAFQIFSHIFMDDFNKDRGKSTTLAPTCCPLLCCHYLTLICWWIWARQQKGLEQLKHRGTSNDNKTALEGHKVKWWNGRRVSHSLLGMALEHGCPNLELVAVCFWLAGWARNTWWTFARLSIYNEQLAACQHLKCSHRPQVLVKNRCLPCIS